MAKFNYKVSDDKVNNLKNILIKLKDDKSLSPVDEIKRDTVLEILNSDAIDFKALSFSDDCPPKYLDNSVMLCKYIDGYQPCEECWRLNLSDKKEIPVDDEKEYICEASYNTIEQLKKLEEYEATKLTPEQLGIILDKLTWGSAITDFDSLLEWLDSYNKEKTESSSKSSKKPHKEKEYKPDVDENIPDVREENEYEELDGEREDKVFNEDAEAVPYNSEPPHKDKPQNIEADPSSIFSGTNLGFIGSLDNNEDEDSMTDTDESASEETDNESTDGSSNYEDSENNETDESDDNGNDNYDVKSDDNKENREDRDRADHKKEASRHDKQGNKKNASNNTESQPVSVNVNDFNDSVGLGDSGEGLSSLVDDDDDEDD